MMKHKEGHCDSCGARLVCAHCFTCGHDNQYILDRVIKQNYEMALQGLIRSAEYYYEAKRDFNKLGEI